MCRKRFKFSLICATRRNGPVQWRRFDFVKFVIVLRSIKSSCSHATPVFLLFFESVSRLIYALRWTRGYDVLMLCRVDLKLVCTVCARCQDDNWCCLKDEWFMSPCWRLFSCSFWANWWYRRTISVSILCSFVFYM